MAPHTLLITGANSGFGLCLALLALRQGHKVIATARNVSKAKSESPEVEQSGGEWLELDVTSPQTQDTVAKVVREKNVDVIVNNAGYGCIGPLEAFSVEDMQRQFDTNVYGSVRVMKGAIPTFRERKAGTIVNVSSTAALDPFPASSLYSGSKYALEGITEAVARELKPFDVRVVLVNPGAFRTRFLNGTSMDAITDAYTGTVAEQVVQAMRSLGGKQKGDPEKGAERMLEFITGTGLGAEAGDAMRLLLGSDSLGRMQNKLDSLQKSLDKCQAIAKSCDLPE